MQNRTLDEQLKEFISILEKNKELMDILDFIDSLHLPNYYIAAGIIFQTIWNYYDGKPLNNGIKDIDVVYYNDQDLKVETDINYYDKIKEYIQKKGYTYDVDVSNEARMHLWKKEKNHIEMEPYKSTEDAIARWIVTVHAIGIKKKNNQIAVYAPYGLNDIFTKTLRPIKHIGNNQEVYDKKVESWKKRFQNITIIEW